MLTPRSSFMAGCLLLAALLAPALLQAADNNNLPDNLPDLGTPAASTATAQPNINAQGAGLSYRDNSNGKLISINPQYNKQNGISLGGSLAAPISQNLAVGFLLTAGADKNEWLLNTGLDFTNNQRIIFSLGQLRQKLDFNFISGSQKAQITQDNFAVSYQYLLGKDWLNAAELNAYLSNTGSITLGDKTYVTDTTTLYELWRDPRRIAGGRVSGVQSRLVLSPASKTTVKLGLGAERLTYDYLTSNDSTTRATASAELNQRLDNGFNFRASANAAAAQTRYAVGLGKSFIGGSQLGLDVATIQGRDNTFNDNQVMLSYIQSFGGNNASAFGSNPFGSNATGMNNTALNNTDLNNTDLNNTNLNNTTINHPSTRWTSSLVEQVSRRPSFLPAQVIAKIDSTASPIRLIAINKAALPANSSVAATGLITVPTVTAVSGIAGVTLNGAAFTNAGQFALSGNNLVVNPNLITQPAVGVVDTYVVSMNNTIGGGTTLATVNISRGSVKVDSIVISSGTLVINTAAISGITAPVTGATPVTAITGTGYTGTVTWSGNPTTFALAATYTATITLTATAGYTLTGVTANFFTVAGTSSAATNAVNTGVVTAAFPATGLPAGYVITQTLGTQGTIASNYDTSSQLDGGGTLIWSKNNSTIASPGYGDHAAATSACAAMNTSGALGYSSGWRLPTQQELSGLYNGGTSALTTAGWTLNFTWSATIAGAGNHYVVYLFNGFVDSFHDSFGSYVSCVH